MADSIKDEILEAGRQVIDSSAVRDYSVTIVKKLAFIRDAVNHHAIGLPQLLPVEPGNSP